MQISEPKVDMVALAYPSQEALPKQIEKPQPTFEEQNTAPQTQPVPESARISDIISNQLGDLDNYLA